MSCLQFSCLNQCHQKTIRLGCVWSPVIDYMSASTAKVGVSCRHQHGAKPASSTTARRLVNVIKVCTCTKGIQKAIAKTKMIFPGLGESFLEVWMLGQNCILHENDFFVYSLCSISNGSFGEKCVSKFFRKVAMVKNAIKVAMVKNAIKVA